jgi:NAD(P)-dependent dehydrogenase (short-subunit alcohol dehydrogenase family)
MSGLVEGMRVVVVGTGVIGSAAIDLLHREGARVVAWDAHPGAAPVPSWTVDATDPRSIAEAMTPTLHHLGGADAIVNTVGIATVSALIDTSLDEWRRVVDVNLTGAFLLTQAFAQVMSTTGGSVVHIGSISGLRGERMLAAYCASKFGLIGLVQSAALELAPWQIRVNCVAPGAVDSPMNDLVLDRLTDPTDTDIQQRRQQLADRTPLGRLCTGADVAETIAFMISDRASFITGQTIPVHGGLA